MTNFNESLDDIITAIKALAQKEIELCDNLDQLLSIRKRWERFLNGLNKHLAGKGPMPYFDEMRNVQYDN
jgi:hypothetical protein